MPLRLDLSEVNLGETLKTLAADIASSGSLRDNLAANPLKVLIERAFPGRVWEIPEAQLSRGDSLLLSAMANPDFVARMSGLQRDMVARYEAGETVTREVVIGQVAEVLTQTADPAITGAWLNVADASNPGSVAGIFVDEIAVATKAVILLLVVITAIDVTPYAPDIDTLVSPSEIQALSSVLTSRLE